MEKPQTCIVKLTERGNMPCGQPAIYLTAEAAQASERGQYSGWRHADPAHDEAHHAVPKSWVG